MLISLAWLNRYLDGAPHSAERVRHALIEAGFPIESATALPGGDLRLDVEITSNRGDCLSHVGLAREVAAKLGIALRDPLAAAPTPARDATSAASLVRVENTVPDVCPRFTARVIRGVKVGPSPAWLREALEAVGQRSISNIVDVTNFLNFELGHPCHAFDLAKLGGAALVIRYARESEKLTTLDGKARTLRSDELVVADAQRAQGLAGVIGGGESEVSGGTTDVVLEVATWDPVTVRRAARRHGIRTDASYRYERFVDPRCVDAAAERAAALMAEVSGGRVCAGAVEAGPALAPRTRIVLRPARCHALLGCDVPTERVVHLLGALGVEVSPEGASMACTVPAFRPDLLLEIDLIEEVGRLHGLEKIPIHERMSIVARGPQESERARRELDALLTGMGFFETVTFSFTSPPESAPFLPAGLREIRVDDERRKADPVARPSVLPGLLACRRGNQHAGAESGVRLFETSSVFAQDARGNSVERTKLGLLVDCPVRGKSASVAELQAGIRVLRGAIEALVRTLAGTAAPLVVEPASPPCAGFDPKACATLTLGSAPLGWLGLVGKDVQAMYDLSTPVVGAELDVARLVSGFPPGATVAALPQFPGIERDVSLVVDEPITWDRIAKEIARSAGSRPGDRLAGWEFVTTYRGAQLGKGRKSMTVRLRFRDPARTLRHEEVDGPVEALLGELKGRLGAEVRA